MPLDALTVDGVFQVPSGDPKVTCPDLVPTPEG
jgi:hypothetical protein